MKRFAVMILLISSCSSTPPAPTGSSSPGPTSGVPTSAPTAAPTSGPSSGPTSGPTAPPTGAPTDAPTGQVPAGVQFGAPVALPDSSHLRDTPYFAPDGTVLITAFREGPKRGLVSSSIAHALIGSLDGGWQDVELGGVDYPSPPGFPNARGGGALPDDVVLGDSGWVAVGKAIFFDRNFGAASAVAAIWHSSDGIAWQLIDPRALFGADKLSTLNAVAAVPGGYIAAGRLADSSSKPTTIEILGSADGVDWQRVTTIDSPYTLDPDQLLVLGDQLLLTGVEYACTTDSTDITTFGWAPQLRIWRSTDAGASWDQADLLSSGVITQPEPVPQDPADCPASGQERNDRFRTTGSFLGVADGRVFLASLQGDQVAASSDLGNWTYYTLPGAIAEGDHGGAQRVVTLDDAGLRVISLEYWRDPVSDRALSTGYQTIVWQLMDDGSATRLPAGRPMLDGGALVVTPSSGIWLYDYVDIRSSVAGPLVTWGSCTPAPLADCTFSNAPLVAPGADLHGIDLRASRIGSGDLSGTNLAGANLDGATIYASLENADLSDVSAVNTSFYASLAGANLSGAQLGRTRVDATFFDATLDGVTSGDLGVVVWIDAGQTLAGHDFAGQNLVGYAFHSFDDGSLRDADFSGANLGSVSFSGVDLTGADFSGARLESVYFGSDTTCPDGDPVDSTKFGKASCRL